MSQREVIWDSINYLIDDMPGDKYEQLVELIRSLDSLKATFTVIAGKWDDQERNCKYCEDFDTLAQAIEAYDKVSGYPWAFIEYQGRVLELWDKGAHPLR
ncbi:hypothetical protein [uncultured Amphritea sp.]|uniref:hypothetical protein n=1 Tax=uncultured Amphritea sp. TaxID=981605 RepID=UPI0026140E10|nr:hypothetical protein [uncultured Amphritea sp.]